MLHQTEKSPTAYKKIYEGSELLIHCDADVLGMPAFREQLKALLKLRIKLLIAFDDTTVHTLLCEHQGNIRAVMLLSQEGGITSKREGEEKPRIISLLSKSDLQTLLASPDSIRDAVRRDVQAAVDILNLPEGSGTNRVVITKPDGLAKEIFWWNGTGTLCFNERGLQVSLVKEREREIIDAVDRYYEEKKIFRKRTFEPTQEMQQYIMRIDHSPIGGFSLITHENGWIEIARIWAGMTGNGTMAERLIEAALKQIDGANEHLPTIIAVSGVDSLVPKFEAAGFSAHNLADFQDAHPDALPQSLRPEQYPQDEAQSKKIFIREMSE